MIQIPITGVQALLDAAHAGPLGGFVYLLQTLIDYQPYVNVYFQ